MNLSDIIGKFMDWGRSDPQLGDTRLCHGYRFTVKESKPPEDGQWRNMAARSDGSWLVMEKADGGDPWAGPDVVRRPEQPGEYIHDGDAVVVREDGETIRSWAWPIGDDRAAAFANCRDRADKWERSSTHPRARTSKGSVP